MPPRKQKPNTKTGAKAAADDDADLDALLDAAIRENEAVPGSLAAQRLEQEQREARKKAEAEAKYVCAHCGVRATKRCGGCEAVRYCTQECLTKHWPVHQLVCEELKEAAAEAAAVKAATRAAARAAAEAATRVEAAASAKAAAKGNGKGRKSKEEEVEEHGNCWTCGADDPPEMCGECRVAKYCDAACQGENWAIHKGRCADLKSHTASYAQFKAVIKAGPRGLSRDRLGCQVIYACILGRLAAVEKFIAAGGSVNYSHEDTGNSPLIAASFEGHFFIIDALVRHGAQVNARNKDGHTALIIGCEHGQVKAAAALLQHGAQVDASNNKGFGALYMASQNNHTEVVALLLEKGAQVNLPTNEGFTPLIASAFRGHAACVRLLLQAGADPLLSANNGGTALAAATQENHPEVVARLQARCLCDKLSL